ncbi:TetR/AcrR family transcriptional regulator [Modestobacter roseus]|uniref:TetR family transcriptional regulator n=1 Tax=Modestobacter roseus TaxID=1181884 RepID=A0A562IRV3_9ACTN|nr:TetR/AcrR family transcriptional regulator [Modestobacter roseus]MQA35103.1 TetR family transcriptional regulator [Modestobacter roseus]TWH73668.1 TetR family transcriptional regulator [Modestobacter roseus]
MVEKVPYRRSNLREALLDRALLVLRDRGAAALSLRELARDVGVSHAAPSRHFADRQQLLDAVAVEGFRLLAVEIAEAVGSTSEPDAQVRRLAHAYLAFAIEKANLVEVMYRHETGRDAEVVGRSAAAALEPLVHLFRRTGQEELLRGGDAESAATLFLAMLQGLAALVSCGVVPPAAVPALVDDAVPRFIGSGARPRDQRS